MAGLITGLQINPQAIRQQFRKTVKSLWPISLYNQSNPGINSLGIDVALTAISGGSIAMNEVKIAGVMFKNSSRTRFVDPGDYELKVGDKVLVRLDQDAEVGEVVIAPNQVIASRFNGRLWTIIRVASASDIEFGQVSEPGEQIAGSTGGLGRCGQPHCCTTLATDFVDVPIAQDQEQRERSVYVLGACGKELCQMNEPRTITPSLSRLPRLGQIVDTPEGEGFVKALNIWRETATVELPNETSIELPVNQCNDQWTEQI
jgi:cell fate regulator YaaT (PSP1 superfamily)